MHVFYGREEKGQTAPIGPVHQVSTLVEGAGIRSGASFIITPVPNAADGRCVTSRSHDAKVYACRSGDVLKECNQTSDKCLGSINVQLWVPDKTPNTRRRSDSSSKVWSSAVSCCMCGMMCMCMKYNPHCCFLAGIPHALTCEGMARMSEVRSPRRRCAGTCGSASTTVAHSAATSLPADTHAGTTAARAVAATERECWSSWMAAVWLSSVITCEGGWRQEMEPSAQVIQCAGSKVVQFGGRSSTPARCGYGAR